MSHWYLQRDGESVRPMAFDELVHRVADGSVADTDLVRSEPTSEWQTVDSVIGLDRAVRKLLQARGGAPDTATAAAVEAAATQRPPISERPARGASFLRSSPQIRPWPTAIVALLLAVVGWLIWSGWHEARRFPRPAGFQAPPVEWWFPLIGPVSVFEFGMLCFDVVMLVTLVVWALRRKR